MDTSAVRRIVERALGPMSYALWLGSFRLTVVYEKLDPGVSGQCSVELSYRRATITLDPLGLEDEDEVLRTLRHELLHVVLSERKLLLDVASSYTPTKEAQDALVNTYGHVWEVEIVAIEQIMDFCGLTPRRLVAVGNKSLSGRRKK